eukprot:COSAG01_NODE_39868_length_471_cov_0.698925_1_plen_20_part_01
MVVTGCHLLHWFATIYVELS